LDQPFEQVPGVTVAAGTVVKHTTCPTGRCASCNTDQPYAHLVQVPEMDDPDMLACADVYACQVRAGELDPDDVPGGAA
jgi:histone acetyltransferase (RNA polymerase elongator complex component)